jgi:uncharacterized membrane protein YdjX (TVP38/TMEM64 family)
MSVQVIVWCMREREMPVRRRSSRGSAKKVSLKVAPKKKSSTKKKASTKKKKGKKKKASNTAAAGAARVGSNGGEEGQNVVRNLLILLFVFMCAGYYLHGVFSDMPSFGPEDLRVLRVHGYSGVVPGPKSIADVKAIKEVIMKYREAYYEFVLAAFAALYVFMQVFAIPGSIFLSVLAGPLFGALPGVAIVSLCATSGSSLSFLLSKAIGGPLVRRASSSKLQWFQTKISQQVQSQNLFWFLLFLRLTPLLPNVFINVASPLVGVPLPYFFCATLLGLMPANYLHAQTGLALSEITDDGLTEKLFYSAIKISMFGLLALLPTILKKKLAERSGMTQVTLD